MYGCASSMTPHVREMISRTRSSKVSGVRRMASGTPAALVSATALAPAIWRRVKSVIGRTIGMGIETRSLGKSDCIPDTRRCEPPSEGALMPRACGGGAGRRGAARGGAQLVGLLK